MTSTRPDTTGSIWIGASRGGYALACVLGCGPTVSIDSDGQTGDGGPAQTATDTDSSASGGDAGSADGVPTTTADTLDGTAGPPGVCGDGIQDDNEACDDGNATNADGCSAQCQISGTLLWSMPMDAEAMGFGVGIDVRDGDVYTAVQVYGELLAPAIVTSRVHRDGVVRGSYVDVGGFSDVDVARQPIASTPQGDVIAGYGIAPTNGDPSTRRAARLNLDTGPAWTYQTADAWGTWFGTIWREQGAFILHDLALEGQDERALVVDWFDHDGAHLGTLPLGVTTAEAVPLGRGALVSRPLPSLGVLTVDPDTLDIAYRVAMIPSPGFKGPTTWYADPVGTSAANTLGTRSFSHVAEVVVWTENERIAIDMLDHVQPATARVARGTVVASFDAGLATAEGSTLTVYGSDQAERWGTTLELNPSYARADGDAGLFVLSDALAVGGAVTLSYYVL